MKTICLDFDGVLHASESPWTTAGEVRDGPVDGAQDFCRQLLTEGFAVVISSTRASFKAGREAMERWLREHDFPKKVQIAEGEKPPAELYADDRGYRFDGNFGKLLEFIHGDMTPWNKREPTLGVTT